MCVLYFRDTAELGKVGGGERKRHKATVRSSLLCEVKLNVTILCYDIVVEFGCSEPS